MPFRRIIIRFFIVVAMVLLWQYLGVSSMAGFAVLVCIITGNLVLSTLIKKMQVQYRDMKVLWRKHMTLW